MTVNKVKDHIVMLVYEDLGSDKPSFFPPDETDKCISRLSEWHLVYGWHAKTDVADKENQTIFPHNVGIARDLSLCIQCICMHNNKACFERIQAKDNSS